MNKLNLLFVIITALHLNATAQTEWIIRDSRNFDYIITTENKGEKIEGKSRSNALIDYLGDQKYNLVKSMSTLKFPEIVHFEGTFSNDSQKEFKGSFNQLFSEIRMEGTISADTLTINLFPPGQGQKKTLIGIKNNRSTKGQDYTSIVSEIIKLTEEYIYATAFIHSKNWSAFKETMLTNSTMIKDNLELQVGFLAIARDFPFTHFNLVKLGPGEPIGDNTDLKEINPATCVLQIKSFAGNGERMESNIKVIDEKNYENLIIDLRDNPGGDNESAAPLLEFLFSTETIIGMFPNKKWYQEKNRPPTSEEFKQFNEFRSGTLEHFYNKAAKGYGSFLKCIPGKRQFKGKVFVIINKNTGSTAEIVALALRENKIATIVGQNSLGAALSAKKFSLTEDLGIFIPLNDYISYSGYRIDKKGIKPDIIVKTQEELSYILQNILKTADLDKN